MANDTQCDGVLVTSGILTLLPKHRIRVARSARTALLRSLPRFQPVEELLGEQDLFGRLGIPA